MTTYAWVAKVVATASSSGGGVLSCTWTKEDATAAGRRAMTDARDSGAPPPRGRRVATGLCEGVAVAVTASTGPTRRASRRTAAELRTPATHAMNMVTHSWTVVCL